MVRMTPTTSAASVTASALPAEVAETRAELLKRLRGGLRRGVAAGVHELRPPQAVPSLPVLSALAAVLPGGLRHGSAYAVEGGALLLSLLAGAAEEGSWCGVIGIPELGVEAAEQAGLDLSRLVLVPRPGDRWLSAAAALAEVMPLVALRPARPPRDAEASRIAARLRGSGAVLLVAGPWPKAEASLGVEAPRWLGLSAGHGRLAARELSLTAVSRKDPRPRRVRLQLPDGSGAIGAATAPPVPRETRPAASPMPAPATRAVGG